MKLVFTTAELEALQPALKGCPDWVTPEGLVYAWRDFVTEVEHGYEHPSYEYVNELGTRDVLDSLISVANGALKERLEAAVEPLDMRFSAATRLLERCLASDCVGRREWWFRVPLRLEDALREDLVDQGLLGTEPNA